MKGYKAISALWFLIISAIAVFLGFVPESRNEFTPEKRFIIDMACYNPDSGRTLSIEVYRLKLSRDKSKGEKFTYTDKKKILNDFCIRLYPYFLSNTISQLLETPYERRTPYQNDQISRTLSKLLELDGPVVSEILIRLLSNPSLTNECKYKIWHHFYRKFSDSNLLIGLRWREDTDDLECAATASLQVLQGDYACMKHLIEQYDGRYGKIAGIINGTLSFLKKNKRFSLAIEEGRKNLSNNQERTVYENAVKLILSDWPD